MKESSHEFEKWVESDIDRMITMQCPIYRSVALSAWQASRESIVVALPKHCERYNWSDGVFNFKQDIAEALRTAGIRIKGESE